MRRRNNVFKANAMSQVDTKEGAGVGCFGRPYQVALCRTRNTSAVLGHNQIPKKVEHKNPLLLNFLGSFIRFALSDWTISHGGAGDGAGRSQNDLSLP